MLVLALLLGCPGKTSVDSFGEEARAWAPPPSQITWVRTQVTEPPLPLPPKAQKATWGPPTVMDDRLVYDVVVEDMSLGRPVVIERTRHFYGPQGYGYLGTILDDGTLQRWDPPQVVLPPHPKVGDTWSATHTKGDRTSERSCELLASEICVDGLVSVCDSQLEGGRIVLRDHFCPGVGWSGFEVLIVKEGQPTVRMWSEDFRRDGGPPITHAGE